MEPTGSVIVPTYNRAGIINRILSCLIDQDCDFNYEIIIADDGSTDSTSFITEETARSVNRMSVIQCKIEYLRLPKRGAAFARNEGVKKSRGEIIFFVDSDVFVKKNFLREHFAYHQKYINVIVQGPVIRTYDIEDPFRPGRNVLTDSSSAFFDTCNVSIRKKHLEKAGYFDEEFTFYGWEDLELGLRLKKQGIKLKKNPSAVGYHFQSLFVPADLEARENKERNRAAGAVLFCNKNPSFEVKLMTQNLPVFFMLEKALSSVRFLLPKKEQCFSFFRKYHKRTFYPAVVDFYFYIRYLRYLSEENKKN